MLKRVTSTHAKWRDEINAALAIALTGAAWAGWVMNILTIWRTSPIEGSTLIRLIGIPLWLLGAILGWL